MEVIFDAKEIMGVTVHQQLKLQYEKQIAALASKILEVKYLSLVDKIVIPENFIQSVLDFQKAQNMGGTIRYK